MKTIDDVNKENQRLIDISLKCENMVAIQNLYYPVWLNYADLIKYYKPQEEYIKEVNKKYGKEILKIRKEILFKNTRFENTVMWKKDCERFLVNS